MPTVIVCFFLLVLLTAAVSLGVLHRQFQAWPPRLWKQKLLLRVADLRARQFELTMPDQDGVQARADRLAADLFAQHLQAISVDRLAEFPGIGPGTVDRVRGEGGRTLADLRGFPFESIPGIGPTKAHDLETAVAKLVRDSQSRFEAGGCPEAEEYRRKLAALQARERDRAVVRQRELAAVEKALASMDELLVDARDVTFWNYLFRRATAGPTDELINRELPSGKPAAPPPVKVARPAPRPVPPPPAPVPSARPVAAKPAPPPAAFPPSTPVKPAAPRPASPPADIFAAELANSPRASAPSADDHSGLPKLGAYVRFAFVVARADGRIAQAERKVIRTFLDEQFGHDPILVRHIDPLMERTESRVPPEAETWAGVGSVTTAAERLKLYHFAERVADASGERNRREEELLERLAAAFGLAPKMTPKPPKPSAADSVPVPTPERPTPPRTLPDPRVVLEIDAASPVTPDLVRRRFTLLSEKLDPAKAAGLGPEFAAMAAEKRGRVRAAAEALLTPFGEPLEKPTPPPPADLRHNPDLDDAFGG
jgi:uncharacterized tellurite resistance protein B-like protein